MQLDRRPARLTIAVAPLLFLVGIAIVDAVQIQHQMPHDRVWLLVLWFLAPSLFSGMMSLLLRFDRAVIFTSAAALPPLIRFAIGGSDASSAFDRLALNPVWFLAVWLPLAGALVLTTGKCVCAGCERFTAFGRRLWRFGAAFVLVFVALTFVSKTGSSDSLQNVTTAVEFGMFLLGVALLIADVVPLRAHIPLLQWTWAIMVAFSLLSALGALFHVSELIDKRDFLRTDIQMQRDMRAEEARIVAQYESRGALTPADREMIAKKRVESFAEERRLIGELQRSPSPAFAAMQLFPPTATACAVFVALFVQATRARRHPRVRLTEPTPSEQAAVTVAH